MNIKQQIIKDVVSYPNNYKGFTITQDGGTVRHLAWKFGVLSIDLVVILRDMVIDGLLVECGEYGFDTMYKVNQTIGGVCQK